MEKPLQHDLPRRLSREARRSRMDIYDRLLFRAAARAAAMNLRAAVKVHGAKSYRARDMDRICLGGDACPFLAHYLDSLP